MGENLKFWSRDYFGNVGRDLKRAQNEVEDLQKMNPTNDTLQRLNSIKSKINVLLHKQGVMWLQRSRINWLKEGD